jgi:hypothetical protein
VNVAAEEHRNGCAERGDLRQREIDEDDAALDDVEAELREHPGQDETGDERRQEKLENAHQRPAFFAARESARSLTS